METQKMNPNFDPTGKLNRHQFIFFRIWAWGFPQKNWKSLTGKSKAWCKKELPEIINLIDDNSSPATDRAKKYIIMLAWKQKIFTEENNMPFVEI